MYKEISKKIDDSPKHSGKSVTTGTIQKRAQLMTNNTGLPDNLKSGVESLSGLSMNDVRVHFNSSRPAQLYALAYTQGTDIHVAPGQEKHLPHEAWHVVQQKQHRVKPTMQMMDISVNDDTTLEHEADVMGAKAVVQGKADSGGALYPKTNATTESIVQRMVCSRCMCGEEVEQIYKDGFFKPKGNSKGAKWCTKGSTPNINSRGDATHDYTISFQIDDDYLDNIPTCDYSTINSEADHPQEILLKSYEPNNFGLGCGLLPGIPIMPFVWKDKEVPNSSKTTSWLSCDQVPIKLIPKLLKKQKQKPKR